MFQNCHREWRWWCMHEYGVTLKGAGYTNIVIMLVHMWLGPWTPNQILSTLTHFDTTLTLTHEYPVPHESKTSKKQTFKNKFSTTSVLCFDQRPPLRDDMWQREFTGSETFFWDGEKSVILDKMKPIGLLIDLEHGVYIYSPHTTSTFRITLG